MMGKRAIKKPKANTSMTFEGLNVQTRGSKSMKGSSQGLPLTEGTGIDNKADSLPLKKKPNLEQVVEISPDTSQGDI